MESNATDGQRPGTSGTGSSDRVDESSHHSGVPVLALAAELGPAEETYDKEFDKLYGFMMKQKNLLGPATPVVPVNDARNLFRLANRVVGDPSLAVSTRCSLLFNIFDALVLVYKNLSLVHCERDGARSVYGYSELALKNVLSRVEAMTRRVAVKVHDLCTLLDLNAVVATARQQLSQVRNEQDMLAFFRGVSNGPASSDPSGSDGARLPRGVERYDDPYDEASTLLRRLYATVSGVDYVRELHDSMFLMAKSNAPAALTSALETRLADRDRNVVLFEAPGDRMFASTMCASAIGYLRRQLRSNATDDSGDRTAGTRIETYRVNFGRIFSKYRGESERNFDEMMDWIKNKVRASDRFRVFWFPDIENLMSPRSGNDQEHITTIKNSMLQHMDAFNKDHTLRSYLLLFNSSEGPLDSAFARRLETVVKTPPDPMTDTVLAFHVVGAETARFRLNLTDRLALRVASEAATASDAGRVGGYAHVQASLRDMYVNQKLILSHDARAIDAGAPTRQELLTTMGRYLVDDAVDVLYDLDGRHLRTADVVSIAFSPASGIGDILPTEGAIPIKYNATVRGDPKEVDAASAARTCFLHDI